MIDPKEFLSSKNKEDESMKDAISVSGTFMCQECSKRCMKAKLDESRRLLVYFCDDGHRSEARL